ncbi:lysophospholipid acyltransferase family protein [Pimelobacter simplex]|uniref:1-acyl-sn-glycerol-3-phosphate acyltransferase n=1 Tax=Nocardioides simplex TaxID=2045 RepID=A0A0A1DJ92_NOCSI|nr:lysophospholipid acyltransferase family protein [Pimelobacter simplex]AIY17394.1 1-acyl-sn-glycerol-3-phosphate acyltransferase [Pimelobacter simplex]GEB14061.1 1-acyl-sn-glycerol-3-phosphate acyltransferase [Pimelobacter simplex]SFM64460.1 1-acyl-sn-glycerol-3-phosphate acyltransferase [Pimelobacter simplex]
MSAHLQRPRSDAVRTPARGLLVRGRRTSRWLIRRRWDVRVHHAARFPDAGPAVVAGNHIGFVDGPLMAIFAPRPVHALTKIEMFTGPLGAFLRASGQVPLDRDHTDPAAVRIALRVLREGHAVGVFPEGTRGPGDLETFHGGAAYLALVTGAPVVPLTFLGSRDPGGSSSSLPHKGARIDIVVGEPYAVDAVPWPRTRENVLLTSAALRDHMQRQLAEALDETGRSLPGPLPQGERDE